MLIVGDAAIKANDPTYVVDSMEVLCDPSKEKEVLKELGVTATTYMKIDNNTKLYKKGITPIVLISTDKKPYLRLLVKKNMAFESLKIATPSINYMYLASMCNLRFKNPNIWFKILKQVKKLEHDFYRSFITEDSIEKNLTISKFVGKYFAESQYIDKNPIKRIGFKKYTRYSISGIISEKNSTVYRRLTLPGNDEYFNKNIFKELNHEAKINVCLMVIYMDLINEFLIPEYEIVGSYPFEHRWRNLFNKSLMDFCLEENTSFRGFMQEFVLNNIEQVYNYYDSEVIRRFINASLKKEIKEKI